MSRLLFQRVPGVTDETEVMKTSAGSRHGREAAIRLARSTDKLHEECGVVAVYGHPHAARETFLGL